jgi:hypothetical protein
MRIPTFIVLALVPLSTWADPGNSNIDYAGFTHEVMEAAAVRESRRISEADFVRMAHEPGTVVLDARTERLYDLRHIAGARNIPFPEFTAETLARVIPSRDTRVLIYCNNNFPSFPESMPTKAPAAALNVSTFVALRTYGYRNVYELRPLIDPRTTQLEFEGKELRRPSSS